MIIFRHPLGAFLFSPPASAASPLRKTFPGWYSFILRNDAERRQDFREAQRKTAIMGDLYAELGYRVLALPSAA